jgi:hypothetical protein
VLALKLTQENYVRALAAMMYEAEHGARASAHSAGASRGRPLPTASASSPGILGVPSSSAAAKAAAASAAGLGLHGGAASSQQQKPIPASGRAAVPAGIPASSFNSQPGLSPAEAAAAATAAAAAAGSSSAVPLAAATGMQSSICGSIPSCREAGAQLSSSTGGGDSTAPLSVLAATTNTSSSGSLVMRGGSGAQRTSGQLGGVRPAAAGSTANDDSAPLKLIGSGEGTDDEGQDPQHHRVVAAAAFEGPAGVPLPVAPAAAAVPQL